jgi:hypothetical protein
MNKQVLLIGWLSGIVDGEGCLQIVRDSFLRGSPRYSIAVSVASVCKPVLDRCLAIAGGSISGPRTTGKTGRCKPHWKWYIKGSAAASMLREISPIMVVKQEQANMLLHFRTLIRVGASPGDWGRVVLSPEQNSARLTLKLAVNALNWRGTEVIPNHLQVALAEARRMLSAANASQ